MKAIRLLAFGVLLAACGNETSDEEEARGGVIGEAYVESIEAAEAVEDLALEQKERVDAALEEAAGGE